MGPRNKIMVNPRGRIVAASKPGLLMPMTSAKLFEAKSYKIEN